MTRKTGQGTRIGKELAGAIIGLYDTIPQVKEAGFIHFEEIQLLVENVGKDRVSDIACSFAKSFLIDYTIEHCEKWGMYFGDCQAEKNKWQFSTTSLSSHGRMKGGSYEN